MPSASESSPLLHASAAAAESSASVSGPRTLSSAREAFVDAVRRDTPGTDLPRYVAVLDALLAWSATHAEELTFRAGAGAKNGITFTRAGTTVALWSARPVRGDAPALEIAS